MALKGIIFSVLLSAAGTTTAAIPIASKYGKERIEKEKEKLLDKQAGLNIQKKGLEKAKSDAEGDKIKAQSARDESEKEKKALNEKGDSLKQDLEREKQREVSKKQDLDRWEKDYKQQKVQNEQLTQDLESLKRQNQELTTKIAAKSSEIEQVRKGMRKQVVDYISKRLEDPTQLNLAYDYTDRAIYDKLKEVVQHFTSRPWDTEPDKWNCKHTIDSNNDQFGIAYCVLKEQA